MAVLGASTVGRDRSWSAAGFADESVSAGDGYDFGLRQPSEVFTPSVFVNRQSETGARCQ